MGKGIELGAARDAAARAGLTRATFTGARPYAELPAALARSEIVLGAFGKNIVIARQLQALADEVVDWDERAIVDAIRRQARHEETTRWDTIEFKLD